MANYTNSSLVNYTKLSPNHSGQRNQSLYIITPHCVVGQCSVETLGNIFAPTSREASSNYGIGYDGRVGMYVEEKNRSWCSGSNWNDQRAITIECASDTTDPYAVNDVVYKRLIELCIDICKRYGKKKLLWLGSKDAVLNYSPKDDEMVLSAHRWFANKSCPGEYLYSRFGDLASKVTAGLNSSTATPATKSVDEIAKEVIQGKWGNGSERKTALTNAGYNYTTIQSRVNEMLNGVSNPVSVTPAPAPAPTPVKKSIEEVAKEVIQGKYGNGQDRIAALKKAGYDYNKVQAIVNQLMSGVNAKKSIDEIAKEVIQGKWGNGAERKSKLTAAGYNYNAVQNKVNQLLK